MAQAQSILSQINSTNYTAPITTIYKPQADYSGFITTLRLTINLNSIETANFPYIPDDTPADVLQQILEEVALNTEFKEVVLYLKKGNEAWIERAPIRIFNKDPYYDVNLMRFFSDANTIDVSEDLSLGIQLKIGNVLTAADNILIWGTVVEEKKNNGNEELAAAIEALQLAVFGRLTDLAPGTLLGRNAGTGVVELIPQNQFLSAAATQTALDSKVDLTSTQTINATKIYQGKHTFLGGAGVFELKVSADTYNTFRYIGSDNFYWDIGVAPSGQNRDFYISSQNAGGGLAGFRLNSINYNLSLSGVLNLANTTEATSTTTGGFILSGGGGVAKSFFVGQGIYPCSPPNTAWGIDFTSGGSTITLAAGATYDLATGSGMVVIYDSVNGNFNFMFATAGNVVSVSSSSSSSIVAGSPASDKVGLFYNGETAKYRILNNRSTSRTLIISTIKMRAVS